MTTPCYPEGTFKGVSAADGGASVPHAKRPRPFPLALAAGCCALVLVLPGDASERPDNLGAPETAEQYLQHNDYRMSSARSRQLSISNWFFFESREGIRAATPTGGTLRQDLQTLRRFCAGYPGVAVVSANLRSPDGELAFPEYTIIERDGVRFGVTGVTQEPPADSERHPGSVTFGDVAEDLRRVLPRLRKVSDIVVVLAFADVYAVDPAALAGADILVVPSHMPRSGPLRIGSIQVVPTVTGGLQDEVFLALDSWILESRARLRQ
jgi:hypothetical protein